jgi:hypothetical protein
MGSGAGGGWRCSLGDGSHCEADSIVRFTAPYCCHCLRLPHWSFPGTQKSYSPQYYAVWVSPEALLCPAILELLPSAEGRPFALTTEEPCHYCMHNGYSHQGTVSAAIPKSPSSRQRILLGNLPAILSVQLWSHFSEMTWMICGAAGSGDRRTELPQDGHGRHRPPHRRGPGPFN